jgi:hypothetical protein
MKLTKKTFRIKIKSKNGGWTWEEVDGFTSEFFGIHKCSLSKKFHVTHLPTGLCLWKFELLKQARAYVEAISKEEFPVSWENTVARELRANGEKAIALRFNVLSSFRVC